MKIHAIIPTVGRPELRRAVESVLHQTVPVRPVVVLDRPELENQVHENLRGLEYELLLTQGGIGGSAARNLGVSYGDCEVIAFLDDDDEWLPTKTARQLMLLRQQPEAVISSRAILIGRETRVVPEQPFAGAGPLSTYLLTRSTLRLRVNFLQSSTLLASVETARRFPWSEDLVRHQDWGWLISLDREGIRVLTEPEALVRVFQGSSGSISRSTAWRASEKWLEDYGADASTKAKADFMAAIVLRAALASGDWRGATRSLAKALALRPHLPALLVGLSALVSRARRHT